MFLEFFSKLLHSMGKTGIAPPATITFKRMLPSPLFLEKGRQTRRGRNRWKQNPKIPKDWNLGGWVEWSRKGNSSSPKRNRSNQREREGEDRIKQIPLQVLTHYSKANPWNLRAELLRMRGTQNCMKLQIWVLRETMMRDGEGEGAGKVQGK